MCDALVPSANLVLISCSSGEDDENVKSLRQQTIKTVWLEKLTSTFSLGELTTSGACGSLVHWMSGCDNIIFCYTALINFE